MIKARVGVRRTVGQPNYSSIQASLELELELDSSLLVDDVDRFREALRGAYSECETAVNLELERMRAPQQQDDEPVQPAPAAEPDRRPAAASNANGSNGHGGKARLTWETAGPRQQGSGGGRGGDRRGGGDRGVPRSGKAFFAWLKSQEEERGAEGLVRYINGWAKINELPALFVDWTESEIANGHAEACRALEGAAN